MLLRATSLNSRDPGSQPHVTRGPGLNTSPGGRAHRRHLSPADPMTLIEEPSWILEGTWVLQLVETRKPSRGVWLAVVGRIMLPPPLKDVCILIPRTCDYVISRGEGESMLQVELRF